MMRRSGNISLRRRQQARPLRSTLGVHFLINDDDVNLQGAPKNLLTEFRSENDDQNRFRKRQKLCKGWSKSIVLKNKVVMNVGYRKGAKKSKKYFLQKNALLRESGSF